MRALPFGLVLCLGCGGAIVEPPKDAGADVDGGKTTDGGGTTDAGTPTDAGTTADAGMPDAGPRDAGITADAGTPDAGGCAAMFCDGFEKYDAGGPPRGPWTSSVQGGTVTIDASKSHGGARAVRVTTDGTQAYRRAYFSLTAPFFPVAGNAFFGRMWVYLTAAPAMTTHWTNISGEGTAVSDAGTPFNAFVRYGGQVQKHLMANYDSSVFASDCWQHSAVAFPEGKWACMEWRFDGPNGKMEFWLDGAQLSALTVNQTGQGCIANGLGGKWVMPAFSTLRLGWEHYQTSIPIELWVDDVALDVNRIGCQ